MSKHSALNTFGRSGNPAFSRNFNLAGAGAIAREDRMTLDGAVNKTVILLSLCFAGFHRMEYSSSNDAGSNRWCNPIICDNI